MSKFNNNQNIFPKKLSNAPKFNIIERINELKTNDLALTDVLQALHGLTFNGKQCNEYGGVKLWKKRGGVWYMSDFSAHTDIAGTDTAVHIFHIINNRFDLTTQTGRCEAANLLYQCGYISAVELSTFDIQPQQQLKPTFVRLSKVAKETDGDGDEKRKKPIKAGWNTRWGAWVLDYLTQKTGCNNTDLLDALGAFPVEKMTAPNGWTDTIITAQQMRIGFEFGDVWKVKYPKANQDAFYLECKRKNPKATPPTYAQSPNIDKYVFGYQHAFTHGGRALFVVGGETDVICINNFCNTFGIYAVCSQSENAPKFGDCLQALGERFDRVIFMYDNDYTGLVCAQQHALKYGFEYINPAPLYDQFNARKNTTKDICDIYKENAGGVATFLTLALETNGRWGDKTDKFTTTLQAVKIPFNQYLTPNEYDPTQNEVYTNGLYINSWKFIYSQLMFAFGGAVKGSKKAPFYTDKLDYNTYKAPKICLVANAGAGKTTAVQTIVQTPNGYSQHPLLERYQKEFFILCVPTTSIADQQAFDFERAGVPVELFKGNAGDVANLYGKNVIICVYDSLYKLDAIIGRAFVIVDELHEVVKGYSYRCKEAFRLLHEVITSEQTPVLGLTATPIELYLDKCNFTTIICNQLTHNQITLTPYTHKLKRKDIPTFLETQILSNQRGVCCVLWNNSLLNELSQTLWTENQIKAFTVHSKKNEYKEQNPVHDSIMKRGELPHEHKDTKALTFTSIYETGVSFKFDVGRFILVDCTDAREIIQYLNRPRYNAQTGTNKHINASLLVSEKVANKETSGDALGAAELFEQLLGIATNAQTIANARGGKFTDTKAKGNQTHSTDGELFIYSQQQTDGDGKPYQVAKIDTLGIFLKVYENELKNTTFERALERVKLYDKRFTINPIESAANVIFDPEFEQMLEAVKGEQTAQQDAFNTLLTTPQTREQTLEAIAHYCKNVDLKKAIRDVYQLPKYDAVRLGDFIQQNKDSLRSKGALWKVQKALDLIDITAGTDKFSALDLVAKNTKAEIKQGIDTLIHFDRKTRMRKSDNGGLKSAIVTQCERVQTVYKNGLAKFARNALGGQIKNSFTGERVLDVVQKAVANTAFAGTVKTAKQALDLLRLEYVLDEPKPTKKGGKVERLYAIIQKK